MCEDRARGQKAEVVVHMGVGGGEGEERLGELDFRWVLRKVRLDVQVRFLSDQRGEA